MNEGDLLWQPSSATVAQANLTRYLTWLHQRRGLTFASYRELWHWSVTESEAFWASIWDFCGIVSSQPYSRVLAGAEMPGAQWFVGAELNFAENIFARMTAARPMLLYKSEDAPLVAVSWQEVYDQVKRLAATLRTLGVQRGDRVVAYLPNIPETLVAFLACASLGAVWSSCSPDFGSRSVLDRFSQIEPKVLIAVDSYRYGGKLFDRRDVVAELQAALPTVERTILLNDAGDGGRGAGGESDATRTGVSRQKPAGAATLSWAEALAGAVEGELHFAQVPFEHPLWILYSSGTTGLPKPIVQGHGGILVELAKQTTLHNDLKPGDRFFWFTSTGWMMWNYLVGSLLSGCTIILYNGNPGYPDMYALWRLAAESGMTYFGTSAAYIAACNKAGIQPQQHFDLSRVRVLGSTGSPLSLTGFAWIHTQVGAHIAIESTSGGTDVCTAFLGGVRTAPIYAGEIQGPSLGAHVQAWNEAGQTVLDEVGELVITTPMPSMPLYFWNDPDQSRYRASYFAMFPGVWRHGDWIKINQRQGCVIYGRSDSTINRHGVRMGSSEIYRVVESLDEVLDSLVIDLEMLGRESLLALFVVLRPGAMLDESLTQRIKTQIRQDLSPRHAPDEIFAIAAVPYTLSGKKMEVPIRKILLGEAVEKSANPGAMRNPEALGFFIELAGRLPGKGG